MLHIIDFHITIFLKIFFFLIFNDNYLINEILCVQCDPMLPKERTGISKSSHVFNENIFYGLSEVFSHPLNT